MITPITREAPARRIIAYDLEWFPGTLELRLIGVHDGERYRTYSTAEEFLLGELVDENVGAWFFAHAGGLADFQFLLEKLVDRGYVVKIAFSGSSAIIVEISEGRRRWLLIDSYWLLRSPLAKIGEAIGIKKLNDYLCYGSSLVRGECDGKGCSHPPPDNPKKPVCIYYAPMGELRTYNEQDCLILQRAIVAFQEQILEMGGELCMTQASSAMKLYRRAYLDRTIRTNAIINARARESYVGSRVEPFARRCSNAYYYDINSSFPYAMTFPAPGNMIGGSSRMPTGEDELFLADVEIQIPDMYLPPIPWRSPKDHRVYFPTGAWRSWLWGIDVRLLEEMGGKIVKCHRVLRFDSHTTLSEYALDLYDRRKKSTTEFEKMLYKLLLNSLYGKFGEGRLKTAAYINPEDRYSDMEMLMPGIYMREEEMNVEHEHVPIATHITSFARRTLYRFDKMCLDLGGTIYYNDTDSCVTTISPDMLPPGTLGKELGQMKHEYNVDDGLFVAPKFYSMNAFDIEKQKQVRVVKAKGFSGITYEAFADLVEGRAMAVRRMTRVRELLRSGKLFPREETTEKRLQFSTRPKRSPIGETSSRPWTIKELSRSWKTASEETEEAAA